LSTHQTLVRHAAPLTADCASLGVADNRAIAMRGFPQYAFKVYYLGLSSPLNKKTKNDAG
jgi:hypothetical protein